MDFAKKLLMQTNTWRNQVELSSDEGFECATCVRADEQGQWLSRARDQQITIFWKKQQSIVLIMQQI